MSKDEQFQKRHLNDKTLEIAELLTYMKMNYSPEVVRCAESLSVAVGRVSIENERNKLFNRITKVTLN